MGNHRTITRRELCGVIGVTVVLVAVLYPMIAEAQQKTKQPVCISNLRQCGAALRMYMEDNGTKIPPTDQMARKLLIKKPVCCPKDTEWKTCTRPFGKPMIGSYAYVRSVPGMEKLSMKTNKLWFEYDPHQRIWMVDIFHSSHGIPAPYHAEIRNMMDRYQISANDPDPGKRRMIPDNLIRLYGDGHVDTSKSTPYKYGDTVGMFTWERVMELTACMSSESPCTP